MKAYLVVLAMLLSGLASAKQLDLKFVTYTSRNAVEHRTRPVTYTEKGVEHTMELEYSMCREVIETPTDNEFKVELFLVPTASGVLVGKAQKTLEGPDGEKIDLFVRGKESAHTGEFTIELELVNGKESMNQMNLRYPHVPLAESVEIPPSVEFSAMIPGKPGSGVGNCANSRLIVGSKVTI